MASAFFLGGRQILPPLSGRNMRPPPHLRRLMSGADRIRGPGSSPQYNAGLTRIIHRLAETMTEARRGRARDTIEAGWEVRTLRAAIIGCCSSYLPFKPIRHGLWSGLIFPG